MVGFWYNKDQFDKAGITAPPATWDEFLADVAELKDAGITPIALGGKDKWPGMFWWAYLAVRNCGQAGDGQRPSRPATGAVRASSRPATELKKLIDLEPFQEGFLAAPWDGAGRQAATMATDKAPCSSWASGLPGTDERQLGRRRRASARTSAGSRSRP